MTSDGHPQAAPPPPRAAAWRMLARKDVLAGLMFMAVAAFGLWLSRDYPIGTALRMGTGYVPRLLCWILLGLGAVVFLQGLREAQARAHSLGRRCHRRGGRSSSSPRAWWFSGSRSSGSASSLSILLLVGLGALAARGSAAARDAARRAGADRSLLGDLHPRARAHHPGLAGVVDGAARQPRARVRRRADAGEPVLRARRRLDRHADRRAARHRPDRHHRDAAAADLPSRADLRPDHARRHLLRRAVWRLDHRDPGEPAGRDLLGGDLHRRPPDGAPGPRRRGAGGGGARARSSPAAWRPR